VWRPDDARFIAFESVWRGGCEESARDTGPKQGAEHGERKQNRSAIQQALDAFWAARVCKPRRCKSGGGLHKFQNRFQL
jgi:hypothetical protein